VIHYEEALYQVYAPLPSLPLHAAPLDSFTKTRYKYSLLLLLLLLLFLSPGKPWLMVFHAHKLFM